MDTKDMTDDELLIAIKSIMEYSYQCYNAIFLEIMKRKDKKIEGER